MFAGLDLGTSSLKAILVDDADRVLAEHSVPLAVERPRDGWSEQDPATWIASAREALAALAAAQDCRRLAGIGLAGHMHGATMVGADGQALRPCLLWNDTRAHAEAAALDADPRFRATTGNIVFPGFAAPKVEWVRRHEPEVFDAVRHVLLPKDYLRLWLTGEAVSEMSDAAGTAWLDTGARDWSDDLLAACHLSRERMPTLVEGSAPSGLLRAELAAELGLPRVTVAGGAGDNAAAAIGTGVVADGAAFLSLGTSGVLCAAASGYRPDAATAVHTFCHAVPGAWLQMGVILAATDALEWLSRLTGRSAAQLTGDLGPLQAPAGPLFLPYLGGERTPHNDAQVRGAFAGLGHADGPEELARAVIEGVAFAFADCASALEATGTKIERLIGVGGGTRSDYWVAALATALDMPVELPVSGDFGGAFGAARLAMMADGAGTDIATVPPIARAVEPDPDLRDAFAAGHARHRDLADRMKGLA